MHIFYGEPEVSLSIDFLFLATYLLAMLDDATLIVLRGWVFMIIVLPSGFFLVCLVNTQLGHSSL